MQGIFRYMLAVMVALSHLWGALWWQGIYGVFGFYVISGFLMTLVINQVYTGYANLWRYGANRFLRIFPIYWAILTLAIVLVVIAGLDPNPHNGPTKFSIMPLPETVSGFLGNYTLLYPWDAKLMISQSWSLRVELVFYLAMIILSRRFWIVCLWFIISVVYCAHLFRENSIFLDLYYTAYGASIAFSVGALVYFLSQKVKLKNLHLYISASLFLIHLIFASKIWSFSTDGIALEMLFRPHHYGLFGNIFLAGYVIWAIYSYEEKNEINPQLKSFGQKMGNIAYAIFLNGPSTKNFGTKFVPQKL